MPHETILHTKTIALLQKVIYTFSATSYNNKITIIIKNNNTRMLFAAEFSAMLLLRSTDVAH